MTVGPYVLGEAGDGPRRSGWWAGEQAYRDVLRDPEVQAHMAKIVSRIRHTAG